MTRRIFTACLGTETNSFSPIPTGLSVYQQTMLVRGGQHGERPNLFGVPLIRWKQQAESLGWTVIEGLAAFAAPARALVETGAARAVALSGGCFQNALLHRLMVAALDGVPLLTHRQTPANDGGLALGQAVVAAARA